MVAFSTDKQMGKLCLITIVDTREFTTGMIPKIDQSSQFNLPKNVLYLDKSILTLPIPQNGPKVTAMLWNGLETEVPDF